MRECRPLLEGAREEGNPTHAPPRRISVKGIGGKFYNLGLSEGIGEE